MDERPSKRFRTDDDKENSCDVSNLEKGQYKSNFTVQKVPNTRDKKGVCHLCTEVIPMKLGNTVGLKRHLERKHEFIYKKYFPDTAKSHNTHNTTLENFVSYIFLPQIL